MTTPKLPGQAPTPEQEQMIQNRANYWRQVGNEISNARQSHALRKRLNS